LAVRLEFCDEGAQFGLIVWKRVVGQALSGPIESDGAMMALTNVNSHEEVGGVMLWFSCIEVFMQMEPVGLQHRWQVSASTLRTDLKMFWPSSS
jgi:hypothetical protein